jgi:hypothetical protein
LQRRGGRLTTLLLQRFPAVDEMTLQQLQARLAAADVGPGRLTYGDERVLDFLDSASRRLLRPDLIRRHPELAPLGFFLRRSQLARWLSTADQSGTLRVPRGMVFHVPPSNVATLLVYPWALSMLAGNANVVRLPTRGSAAAESLLGVLCETAADADPEIRRSQCVVAYGHDEDANRELSAMCRLRVIWGGDETVNTLRRFALAPDARDVTLVDRCSLSAISAAGWLAADDTDRDAIAGGFYNDAYWFGQAACASPLTLCWIGPEERAARACADFLDRLEAVVARRQPQIDTEMAIEKRVATYGLAAEGVAVSVVHRGNMLATVSLGAGRLLDRWSGTGTFGLAFFSEFDDLAPLVTRRHQTMSHFGFTHGELLGFARRFGGRGIDRIVPIGEALGFERVWDGYDLLQEFSKSVTVRGPSLPPGQGRAATP